MGWKSMPRFPYFDEQGSGAWIGLFIIALWISREHLRAVFSGLINPTSARGDSEQPTPYRMAVLGIISGGLFIVLFCRRAGMSMWAIASFFGIYFALATAITRMRAELGATHEIYYVNPRRILVRAFGTRAFSANDLTVMSFFYWFNRGYASHPMPNQLEGFKIGELASLHYRRLLYAMLLALVCGIVASFWANLDIIYRYGASSGLVGAKEFIGRECFVPLQRWLTNPTKTDLPGVGFMGFGLAFTFALMVMRMRFLWWPFHPAGYALAVSYAMDYFWFAFFISWVLKSLILRHGGIRAHRRSHPSLFRTHSWRLYCGFFVVGRWNHLPPGGVYNFYLKLHYSNPTWHLNPVDGASCPDAIRHKEANWNPKDKEIDMKQADYQFFKENGYVSLGKILSDAEVEHFVNVFDRDRTDVEDHWYRIGLHQTVNCDALLTSPEFDNVIRHPAVMDCLRTLMGNDPCFSEICIRHMAPYDGELNRGWHRDRPYWSEHPLRIGFMQLMLYLSDVDETTHCFSLSPESMEDEILDTDAQLERGGIADLYGPAGTGILFNIGVLHTATTRPDSDGA